MKKIIIEGNRPLTGEVTISGAKLNLDGSYSISIVKIQQKSCRTKYLYDIFCDYNVNQWRNDSNVSCCHKARIKRYDMVFDFAGGTSGLQYGNPHEFYAGNPGGD